VTGGSHLSERLYTGGRLFFSGDDRLEGILEWPAAGPAVGGVVIAHPHPLYGGTMAQPVVHQIARACRRHQLAALRFNFRGVGRSQGTYSGSDEYRDVEAAAAYLRGRLADSSRDQEPGTKMPQLALAGFSFGSVMAAMAAAGAVPVRALALVAFVFSWEGLPTDSLTRLAGFRGPVLAICGEEDGLAPPEEVEQVLTELRLDFSLSVVGAVGHLFEGRQREVGEEVASFLRTALAAGRGGM
jgi:alpha/beta superfamily hydrolase